MLQREVHAMLLYLTSCFFFLWVGEIPVKTFYYAELMEVTII